MGGLPVPGRGSHIGLGWLMGADGDIIGISGGGPGAFASLLVRMGSPHRNRVAHVALTNRRLPIQAINVRVLRASTGFILPRRGSRGDAVAAVSLAEPPEAIWLSTNEITTTARVPFTAR